MAKHIEIYHIKHHAMELKGPIRYDEGTKEYESMKDCHLHGHTYVYYTPPHEEGECEAVLGIPGPGWHIRPID